MPGNLDIRPGDEAMTQTPTTAQESLPTEAEMLAAPEDEYMSPRQLAFFRARLLAERDALLGAARETTQNLQQGYAAPADPSEPTHHVRPPRRRFDRVHFHAEGRETVRHDGVHASLPDVLRWRVRRREPRVDARDADERGRELDELGLERGESGEDTVGRRHRSGVPR